MKSTDNNGNSISGLDGFLFVVVLVDIDSVKASTSSSKDDVSVFFTFFCSGDGFQSNQNFFIQS